MCPMAYKIICKSAGNPFDKEMLRHVCIRKYTSNAVTGTDHKSSELARGRRIHAHCSYQFPCIKCKLKGKHIFCRFYIFIPSSLLILLVHTNTILHQHRAAGGQVSQPT